MKYQVHTFGCKVNTYDTGLIQKNMQSFGFATDNQAGIQTPIHVLNTCAVTAEATKEAAKLAQKIKRNNPDSVVVVTGCSAQVDTGVFENLPSVDLIIANSHKGMLPDLLKKYLNGDLDEKLFKSNIFKKEDLEEGGGLEETHTRSFLKIQDGCNSFCTYCVIPFARGKSRSVSVQNLIERINSLVALGKQEVVLTGVHIGDYEDDTTGAKLEDLIESLLKNTKIQRLRLTSLEPVEVSDRLLELYQDPRVCAHFHMSIQSAQTDVLKAMKRKYTQEDVVASLNSIQAKVPGAFVGMDVIAGFPNETDSFFEDTYKVLADTPWTRLHVFPYSERPGTLAVKMQTTVPVQERKHRAQKLRELSLHRYQAQALKQIGSVKKVLALKKNGLARDYWQIKSSGLALEAESSVKITAFDSSVNEGFLIGEVMQ